MLGLNQRVRRWLTRDATPDALLLIEARGLRAFADGFTSVLLPVYLLGLGFDGLQIGGVATATLIGSAALTLLIGFVAHRFGARHILVGAALLMAATGVGFAAVHEFWPLVLVAFVGTLNPSSGDASVFLPVEQSALTQTVSARDRTALFAHYSLVGSLLGAAGALCAGIPDLLSGHLKLPLEPLLQVAFVLYGLLGGSSLLLYRRLSPTVQERQTTRQALTESRGIVFTLAALFSLDSFGSGFIVQSLVALWLFQRFELSVATAAAIFFWTGVLSAFSYLVAVRLAGRIGLIKTMVFTHLPANLLLLIIPFMPNLNLAIALLLVRSALSQMDVPTRNSYVMAVVRPEERPAAASVTAVPRTVTSAVTPLAAGYLLGLSTFGWPLIVAGALKAVYDLLLLLMFARVRPPEEEHMHARATGRGDGV